MSTTLPPAALTPRKSSKEVRARVLSALRLSLDEKIALDEAADAAWSKAWDETRDRDAREGRRYDKDRQGEAATAAMIAVYEAALAAAPARCPSLCCEGRHPVTIGTKDGAPNIVRWETCTTCLGSGVWGATEKARYWALAAFSLLAYGIEAPLRFVEGGEA